ncbi:MAG: virulence RhuM family protein [Coprobacillus cateniformis]|mgnify:CR=1 FL=1|nr:virulence RhuM family protein [Coprobacillus cateniformis]
MIISVGYRVKSKRGITFRKWATSILKDYMIQGYAINLKRLETLKKLALLYILY